MLEFHSRAFRVLGDEPHLDLVGVVEVGLDLPVGADVPADNDPVGRLESEHASPTAFAAVGPAVVDVATDVRFEHRLGDGHTEQVVLRAA